MDTQQRQQQYFKKKINGYNFIKIVTIYRKVNKQI